MRIHVHKGLPRDSLLHASRYLLLHDRPWPWTKSSDFKSTQPALKHRRLSFGHILGMKYGRLFSAHDRNSSRDRTTISIRGFVEQGTHNSEVIEGAFVSLRLFSITGARKTTTTRPNRLGGTRYNVQAHTHNFQA